LALVSEQFVELCFVYPICKEGRSSQCTALTVVDFSRSYYVPVYSQ